MIACTHCLGDGRVDVSMPDSRRVEMDDCEHCRGTGAEPCVVPGCRDGAVVFDGEHLCESHEAEFAAMDAAERKAS